MGRLQGAAPTHLGHETHIRHASASVQHHGLDRDGISPCPRVESDARRGMMTSPRAWQRGGHQRTPGRLIDSGQGEISVSDRDAVRRGPTEWRYGFIPSPVGAAPSGDRPSTLYPTLDGAVDTLVPALPDQPVFRGWVLPPDGDPHGASFIQVHQMDKVKVGPPRPVQEKRFFVRTGGADRLVENLEKRGCAPGHHGDLRRPTRTGAVPQHSFPYWGKHYG